MTRRPSRLLLLMCLAAGLVAYAAVSSPLPTPERQAAIPVGVATVAPAETLARFSLPKLSTLTESVDRPLFYANRRPPPPDQVAAPAAVLIRPDGHVAWTGDLADPDLPRALTTWFGRPAQAP